MNIFVITGPSGVGKTHLISELVSQGIYSLPVYTDRMRRPTESGFTDRMYVSQSQFTDTLPDFIYWFEFQGYRYGYKRVEIANAIESNTSIVTSVILSQLPGLIKKIPEAIIIFLDIETGGDEILKIRMVKRDISVSDTEEIKKEKLRTIESRMQFYKDEQMMLNSNTFSFLNKTNNKRFVIKNDETIYNEVIPYILRMNSTFNR